MMVEERLESKPSIRVVESGRSNGRIETAKINTLRLENAPIYTKHSLLSFAIDHRVWNTGLPVRSAVLKPYAGRLVVGWVTTSESLLLIVLPFWPVHSSVRFFWRQIGTFLST
jgi:hypothetical protein